MVKTAEQTLYTHLRNKLKIYRSKKFLKWFREKYPNYDPHHLFGSIGSVKTSDYFCLPLTREEHDKAERMKYVYAIENLSLVLNILQEYINELEA